MNISIQHSDSLLERGRNEEDGEWRENGGREERRPRSKEEEEGDSNFLRS